MCDVMEPSNDGFGCRYIQCRHGSLEPSECVANALHMHVLVPNGVTLVRPQCQAQVPSIHCMWCPCALHRRLFVNENADAG